MNAEPKIVDVLENLGRKDQTRTALEKIKLAESFGEIERQPPTPTSDWFDSLKGPMKVPAVNTVLTENGFQTEAVPFQQ